METILFFAAASEYVTLSDSIKPGGPPSNAWGPVVFLENELNEFLEGKAIFGIAKGNDNQLWYTKRLMKKLLDGDDMPICDDLLGYTERLKSISILIRLALGQ
jgi:hypothetical protein